MENELDKKCKLCFSKNLIEMINLGNLPIAHRYLSSKNEKEESFPLSIHYCRSCGLAYIINPINPEILYKNYNHCFSSWKMQPHIPDEIQTIASNSNKESIIEIACNDGLFLEELKKNYFSKIIGVEPNKIAGEIARKKGFKVYSEMLTENLAKKIIEEEGKFEVVVARQVLEHIPDIENFFKCIDILIKKDGLLFVDIPDIKEEFISMGDLSFVWEEHPNYFTETTLKNILKKFYYLPFIIRNYGFSSSTLAILSRKTILPLSKEAIDKNMGEKILNYKNKVKEYEIYLKNTLSNLRNKNHKIVLYGVGCRSSILLNGLKFKDYINIAIDDQKERHGLFMSGSRLKIHPSSDM